MMDTLYSVINMGYVNKYVFGSLPTLIIITKHIQEARSFFFKVACNDSRFVFSITLSTWI